MHSPLGPTGTGGKRVRDREKPPPFSLLFSILSSFSHRLLKLCSPSCVPLLLLPLTSEEISAPLRPIAIVVVVLHPFVFYLLPHDSFHKETYIRISHTDNRKCGREREACYKLLLPLLLLLWNPHPHYLILLFSPIFTLGVAA